MVNFDSTGEPVGVGPRRTNLTPSRMIVSLPGCLGIVLIVTTIELVKVEVPPNLLAVNKGYTTYGFLSDTPNSPA